MSEAGAVIDLGVYTRESATEPAPEQPWPARARLVRWWRWAAAVLVTVAVLPLSVAAPAPPPQLVPLWTVPGGPYDGFGLAIGETDLYAVAGTGGDVALTAYRLADGAVRWSVPLADPDSLGRIDVAVIDGIPIVYLFDLVGRTSAYDPDTAQLRWTSQGLPDYVGGGMVGLTVPVLGADEEFIGATLELRDVSSGAVAVTFAGGTQLSGYGQVSDGRVLAFGLEADGRLSRYDVATGAVVSTVATEFTARPGAGLPGSVTVAYGLVLVYGEIGVEEMVVAYDATTLERLWDTPGGSWVASCRPVVCVGGLDAPLRGLVPETGTPRWTMTCADAGAPDDCFLFARELGGTGRLLVRVQSPSPENAIRHVIVDAATGSVLDTDLAGWDIVPGELGSRHLLHRDGGVPTSDPSGEAERRIWWARSDPDLERIEVLGAIEAVSCTTHDPYLTCYRADGVAEVWRIAGA